MQMDLPSVYQFKGGTGNDVKVKWDCEHHEPEHIIKFKNGAQLRGFAGHVHAKTINKKDFKENWINVFLEKSFLPEWWVYSNDASLMPSKGAPERVVLFKIEDRNVPISLGEFEWLAKRLHKALRDGETVAISCIGGHGRTGLLMSILYGLMTGSKTPIDDIRNRYCEKAVETYEQKCFVHDYLKLAKPIADKVFCSKCHKNERMERAHGAFDIWCEPCNVEWELEKASRTIQPSPTPSLYQGEKYCIKCYIRKAHAGSEWCGQCIAASAASGVKEPLVMELEERIKYFTDIAVSIYLNKTRQECEDIIRAGINKDYHSMTDAEFGMMGALDWPEGFGIEPGDTINAPTAPSTAHGEGGGNVVE